MVGAVWTNIDPEPLIDDVAINVDPFQPDQIGSEGSEGSYSQRSLCTEQAELQNVMDMTYCIRVKILAGWGDQRCKKISKCIIFIDFVQRWQL